MDSARGFVAHDDARVWVDVFSYAAVVPEVDLRGYKFVCVKWSKEGLGELDLRRCRILRRRQFVRGHRVDRQVLEWVCLPISRFWRRRGRLRGFASAQLTLK
jgi:hypothetical protein